MPNFTHNKFAIGFVVLVACFLGLLVANDPTIEIGVVTGEILHRLMMYTAYWAVFIISINTFGFNVMEELKKTPLAFAVLVGIIIHGAASVIGH